MNVSFRDKLQVSSSILETIGDTPLVQLKQIPSNSKIEVFAKLESFNPSGSVKARTSYNILQKAIESGELKKGDTVIESSSGNMAIGLAQACLVFGLKLIVVVDPKINKITSQLLETYGATIEMVTEPLKEGGFLGARLAKVKELLKITKNSFWSNQYGNINNPKTHYQTTKEIYEALDGRLDYLFVATSTCGTLMGCAEYIKANHPNTKIIAVDAVGSVLFGGEPGTRKIPGHGAGVDSQFLDEDYIHDFIKVNDLECAQGCWELLQKESILVGGSSGAIIMAYHKFEHQIEEGSRCAFLLSDGGSRYLDTIYNQEWLLKNIPGVYDALTPIGGWKIKPSFEYSLAIIGLGPKGLYGLERLLAQLKNENVEETVHIHLYNKNKYFGAGDVYRTDQPDYLKMNFTNEKIDIRPKEKPDAIVKLENYTKWLSESIGIEESRLSDKFSSRKMVGKYLSSCFKSIIAGAPENIKIYYHNEEVVNITEKEGLLHLKPQQTAKPQESVKVHNLLLTTGHAGNRTELLNSKKVDSSIIDFVYPVEKTLVSINAQASVAIKGMGLTFIDATLSLTEGRGGYFVGECETMQYIPSGNEPAIIYPYSRSGALMIPRVGEMPNVPVLRFFTSEKLREIRKDSSHKFDFLEELLPLIKKEFIYRYYSLAFKNCGKKLNGSLEFAEMLEEIKSFHSKYPSEKQFSFEELQEPFINHEAYNTSIVKQSLEEMIEQVSLRTKSPLLAAISAWHDISPIFNELYSFGGLTARSHQLFDNHYAPFFNRISYGPPLENMYKILALFKVGIFDFTFGQSPTIQKVQNGKWQMENISVELDNRIVLDYHIDARIPRMNIPSQSSILYKNLFEEGKIRAFQNTDDTGRYETGGMDLTREAHPIDKAGNVIKNMTVYGTPTEGVTFDNDTLSRSRNDFSSIWAKQAVKSLKNFISTTK